MKPTWPGTSIHTLASLQRSHRRLDRQRQAVAGALGALRAGATLHLQHGVNRPWWILSTGQLVSEDVAAILIARPEIQAVGDGLFHDLPGQTWRYVESREQD